MLPVHDQLGWQDDEYLGAAMKGAFLLSASDHLFDVVTDVLVELGGKYYPDDGAVQLRDELGNLFTVFVNAGPAYEYRSGPLTGAPGVQVPDLGSMSWLAVECRNEKYFAMAVKAIAQASDDDVWVVDGDGIVWPAAAVNPAQVRL
jgi:hypothetical protein